MASINTKTAFALSLIVILKCLLVSGSDCSSRTADEEFTVHVHCTRLVGNHDFINEVFVAPFLPRDARSAKRGNAILSRPFLCPSVSDVSDVPWSHRSG